MQQKISKELQLIFRVLLKIPVPWVFIITYLIGLMLHFLFSFQVFSGSTILWVKIAGAVMFVIGAILAGWSLLIFRKARTTTTPGIESVKMITSGPYRFSRNPMYVSLTLCYIGEAGLLVQVWPLIVLPLVLAYVNWIVIPIEENLLLEVFKEEYKKYKLLVRRWL
jgi:protein-S-isoprenylcysteine O-methyltransferase Ste14